MTSRIVTVLAYAALVGVFVLAVGGMKTPPGYEDQYQRDARAYGVEPEEFLKMICAETKTFSRVEAYTRALAKLKTGRQ